MGLVWPNVTQLQDTRCDLSIYSIICLNSQFYYTIISSEKADVKEDLGQEAESNVPGSNTISGTIEIHLFLMACQRPCLI